MVHWWIYVKLVISWVWQMKSRKWKSHAFLGGLKWKEIFYTLLLTFTWEETTLVEDNTDQQLGVMFFVFFLKETESNMKITLFVQLKFFTFCLPTIVGHAT